MSRMLIFGEKKDQSNIIKVIGVGGGGSNAVTHMYNEGITGVDFVLCNTDSQALDTSPVPNKIYLGKRQLGAGNVPAVGREAALETSEEIIEILEPHTKMLFITAGMGGGTGTGAAPVVAQLARSLNILTVGIVTLPFSFEGKKRRQQAIEGIEELRKHVDTLLIISNDKLREEYGNMRLTEAFKKADDVLTIASKGIAEIITVTGYINVDFEDVKTVMKDSGKAIMGSGKAEGENRAIEAIEEAMRSPLLNDSNISGAKNILLYITSGEEEISLDEVHEITAYIQQICGNSAEVIWGNGVDPTLNKSIALTIIATGFDNSNQLNLDSGKRTVKVTDLYGNNTQQEANPLPENNLREAITGQSARNNSFKPIEIVNPQAKPNPPTGQIIHQLFEDTTDQQAETEPKPAQVEDSVDNSDLYDKDDDHEPQLIQKFKGASEIPFEIENTVAERSIELIRKPASFSSPDYTENEMKREADRRSEERQNRLKALSMKLKTEEGINELEQTPAFARKGTNPSSEPAQEVTSRYSIDSSSGGSGLRLNNPFLHDNVD